MHARLDDMKRTLGEFVKQRRAEMKLSQRELAKLSGLSNTYIASLELDANPATGKSISPTMPTLEKLAKGLRVDAEVLIRIARGEPLEAKKGPPTEEEFPRPGREVQGAPHRDEEAGDRLPRVPQRAGPQGARGKVRASGILRSFVATLGEPQ